MCRFFAFCWRRAIRLLDVVQRLLRVSCFREFYPTPSLGYSSLCCHSCWWVFVCLPHASQYYLGVRPWV